MVVGQDEVIDQLLVCALTGSHALLVGVPGLAKTLMVKALAAAFHWKYARIQFTPDLMPADVTGYELLGRGEDSQGPAMVFRPGPVFANLVLADEINRAAPKTQSALLEAMAERHVTVGGKTYPLEEPFLVAATQNPIEQEGTYPLPEAQLDRFMMEIRIGYPSPRAGGRDRGADHRGHAKLPAAALTARSSCGCATWCWPCPWPRTWPRPPCGFAAPAGRTTRAIARSMRLRGLGRRPAGVAKPGAGGQGPGLAAGPLRPRAGRHPARGPADPAAPHHRQPSRRGRLDHLGRSLTQRLLKSSEPHDHGLHQPVPRSACLGGAGADAIHHAAAHGRDVHSGCHTSRQQGGAGEFVDLSRVLRQRGPAAARLEGAGPDRQGVRPNPRGRNQSGLHAGPRRQRLDGFPRHTPAATARGSKLEYAQYLSTALAHVITRSQDQVGLAVLDEHLQWLLPPGATLTHLSQLYAAIEANLPRHASCMARGLRQLFERCRRRGVLLLISDFLMDDLEDVFAALRLFRHRGWEVVILHLVHPEEERLPEGGGLSASRAWRTRGG